MHPSMQRIYIAFEKIEGFNPFKRQTSLGKLIGETNQTVKNWETRGVSKNALDKFSKRFGINPEWVQTGEGIAYNNELVAKFPNRFAAIPVPLINFKDVDRFLDGVDDVHDFVISFMPCPVRHSNKTFAVVLHTDHTGYLPDEIVYIDPEQIPDIGDDVLAKVDSNGEYNVLRKVANDERGESFLLAISESKLPRMIYLQDAKIIGRAICAIRKL